MYRIVTSALFHKNVPHLLFNALAFGTLATPIERTHGSLFLFWLLFTSILFTSLIYIIISYGMYLISSSSSWIRVRCVGLSGVIFSLAVVDGFREADSTEDTHRRALCGLIRVPRKVYPFLLLLILQFMLPNVSFLGHLSGILYGLLVVHGKMKCVFLSSSKMRDLESRMPSIFTRERIVLTPTTNREDVMSYVHFRETYTEWFLPGMRKVRNSIYNAFVWIRRRVTSGPEYERVSTVDSFDGDDVEGGGVLLGNSGNHQNNKGGVSQREEARLKRLEYLENNKKNSSSNIITTTSSSSSSS